MFATENIDLLINNKQITKAVMPAPVHRRSYLILLQHLPTPYPSPGAHLAAPQPPKQARGSTKHCHNASNAYKIDQQHLLDQTLNILACAFTPFANNQSNAPSSAIS
jgi:hypothetical protein